MWTKIRKVLGWLTTWLQKGRDQGLWSKKSGPVK